LGPFNGDAWSLQLSFIDVRPSPSPSPSPSIGLRLLLPPTAVDYRPVPLLSSPIQVQPETLTLIEALPASELGSLQSPPSRLFATSQESALIQGGHSNMAFAVPLVAENLEGWGPDAGCVPSQLENVPYAPFNKADRLGRASDWTGQAFKYNAGK